MAGTAATTRIERPGDTSGARLDDLIEPYLREAVAALDGAAPLLAGMARYHLGEVDDALAPLPPGAVDRGKRIRPAVALLCCGAAGGEPATAAPLGAAIELLHNFTLIHDDVQDDSPTRRGRATVWSLWGVGQAINAGDALFAAAHLPLYRLLDVGASPALALRALEGFDRMTIDIVAGQTLDLGFEGRADVAPADYLDMIAGKTAAIVRYAAWAGAHLGGADEATAERFAAFGRAVGLGFQVQDDLLGVWGASAQTGDPGRTRRPLCRPDDPARRRRARARPAGAGRRPSGRRSAGRGVPRRGEIGPPRGRADAESLARALARSGRTAGRPLGLTEPPSLAVLPSCQLAVS
jgi:geranylgeranyl pyrophosphate synthase